jgi:hypothetical protein
VVDAVKGSCTPAGWVVSNAADPCDLTLFMVRFMAGAQPKSPPWNLELEKMIANVIVLARCEKQTRIIFKNESRANL